MIDEIKGSIRNMRETMDLKLNQEEFFSLKSDMTVDIRQIKTSNKEIVQMKDELQNNLETKISDSRESIRRMKESI